MTQNADDGCADTDLDEVYFTTKATGRLHRARNAEATVTFCGSDVASMNPLGPQAEVAAVGHHHLICLYCFPIKGDY